MAIWLRAVLVSIAAAILAGFCTAGVIVVTSMPSVDVGPRLGGPKAFTDAILAALLASLPPAILGGLLGGMVAAMATARRYVQSGLAWCLKGAVLGLALGCTVSLLYGALLGGPPAVLLIFGIAGVVAGGFAGSLIGSWCNRVVRAIREPSSAHTIHGAG